ncbi:MAG: hypothetical protein JNK05_11925 [Myxococcales bacterium]|nr:hypothetical protein [Myxococcales bacterium]
MDDSNEFEQLVRSKNYEALAKRGRSDRARWSRYVRFWLCVDKAEYVDANGAIRYDSLEIDALDAPVTEEDFRAWFRKGPPAAAVRAMTGLFSMADPREVSWERYIQIAREEAKALLPEALPSHQRHYAQEDALFRLAGKELGEACGARRAANKDVRFNDALECATTEAIEAFLRATAKKLTMYEVSEAGRWLSKRADVLQSTRDAYAAALKHATSKLKKNDAYQLDFDCALLSAESLAAVIVEAKKHPDAFSRAVMRAASQGWPQGALALERVVSGAGAAEDDALQKTALLALVSTGSDGASALARLAEAQGQVSAIAASLVELPVPDENVWAGVQRSLPRYGRGPDEDLLDVAALGATVERGEVREPAKLEALVAASTAKLEESLLDEAGWADYLHLCSRDPYLEDVPYHYERAKREGTLGRGADPAALVRTLDAMCWEGSVTRAYYSEKRPGVGHLLLWAGASMEVFRHAIGRFMATRRHNLLGSIERHFVEPLEQEQPAWADALLVLLKHYRTNRNELFFQGDPPLLARGERPERTRSVTVDRLDVWVRGMVRNADSFAVRFRESVELSVDVDGERWKLAAKGASGCTPPLDKKKGVRFALELAGDKLGMGVDGVLLDTLYDKIPLVQGAITVTPKGKDAEVSWLEVFAKYRMVASDAVASLLVDPTRAQTHAELAAIGLPSTAHILAATSVVFDGKVSENARKALASMKGDAVAPWRDAAARTKGAKAPSRAKPAGEALTEFRVRPYEDVVRSFEAFVLAAKSKKKSRSKKPEVLRRGQTQHGDFEYATFAKDGSTEDWSSGKAVPASAVYFTESAPDFSVQYLASSLCDLPALAMKGRGTSASMSTTVKKGSYILAKLELSPPDHGDDWGVAVDYAFCAAFKVEEGWAWAVCDSEDLLRAVLGMESLPPRDAWESKDNVTVGDW